MTNIIDFYENKDIHIFFFFEKQTKIYIIKQINIKPKVKLNRVSNFSIRFFF